MANLSTANTFYDVDLSKYDTQGFCKGYPARRHVYEAEANAGCFEARSDWAKYIGSNNEFGCANPINGNFAAVLFPMVAPDRLRVLSYVLEFAALYDGYLEEVAQPSEAKSNQRKYRNLGAIIGKKRMQKKMVEQLYRIDKACARRMIRVWKEMNSMTSKELNKDFTNMEDFLEFRIVDGGIPFLEVIYLFGTATTLTSEEEAVLKEVTRPAAAAIALTNDCWSFDKEHGECVAAGRADKMLNAVGLCMKWHGIDVEESKRMVKDIVYRYEAEHLRMVDAFRCKTSSAKLNRILDAYTYMISGAVLWSINCPRYHPDFRYDANLGLENQHLENPRFYDPTLKTRSSTSASSSEAEENSLKAGNATTIACLPLKAMNRPILAYVKRIWSASARSRREVGLREKNVNLGEGVNAEGR